MDDQIDVVDVDSACSDISGDQDLRIPAGERIERSLSLGLAEVPVNRPGPRTRSPQLRRQSVGAVLGTDEEQCASRTLGNLCGDGDLVLGSHRERAVVHRRHRRRRRREGVQLRIAEVAADHRVHAVVERRREQHALPARPGLVQQRRDRRQEAQIRHEIGFVENRDLDVSERALAAFDEIEEAPRSRYHDIHAPA